MSGSSRFRGRAPRKMPKKVSAPAPRRAAAQAPAPAPAEPLDPLQLGFVRGTAPEKWAKRWRGGQGRPPLELVALAHEWDVWPSPCDVTLVRSAAGETLPHTADPGRARHAVKLYDEAVALVVPEHHELAGSQTIDVDELELVTLLDHANHAAVWPAPQPFADPAWLPSNSQEALDLVATGLGAVLLPLPLARHLVDKHSHAVVEVTGEIATSAIWAVWNLERDAGDVQELIGVLRGRGARSSR